MINQWIIARAGGVFTPAWVGLHVSGHEKNIDSRILLRKVFEMTMDKGMFIENVDITILAQAPRMASFIPNMRENIAGDLETDIENVNVKATTTEGMGFIGRMEGLAVYAVVLLS